MNDDAAGRKPQILPAVSRVTCGTNVGTFVFRNPNLEAAVFCA
jgi:hypothetical protein